MADRGRARLARIETQAASFDRTRSDHRSEIAEDYVELIADLIDAKGEARAVDLAGRLGVTPATVNGTVARLQRAGLVHTEPYRSIFLTEPGRDLAEHCRRRHRVVLEFLKAIGVSDATAGTDAEGIEHHVSNETLEALERVTRERLQPRPKRRRPGPPVEPHDRGTGAAEGSGAPVSRDPARATTSSPGTTSSSAQRNPAASAVTPISGGPSRKPA